MVDWSRYDAEAREAVDAERKPAGPQPELLRRLHEITRLHAERLTAAGVPTTDKNGPRLLWRVDGFPSGDAALGSYFIDEAGNWFQERLTAYADYDSTMRYSTQRWAMMMQSSGPPVLEEDVLASALAGHYLRATGK